MKLTIGFLLAILFLAVVCQQVYAGGSHSTSRSKQGHSPHRHNGHAGGSHSPSRSRQGHSPHRHNVHASGRPSTNQGRLDSKTINDIKNAFGPSSANSGRNQVRQPTLSPKEYMQVVQTIDNYKQKQAFPDRNVQKKNQG